MDAISANKMTGKEIIELLENSNQDIYEFADGFISDELEEQLGELRQVSNERGSNEVVIISYFLFLD